MIRATFLRRMALAAAACAFLDVPWPKTTPATARVVVRTFVYDVEFEVDAGLVAHLGVGSFGTVQGVHGYVKSITVVPGIRTMDEMRALAQG